MDYFFLPLSMLVLQKGVPWFKWCYRGSPGSIMVLVWSLMAFIINLAYQSNLQASLISVEFDEPIENIQVCCLQFKCI